MLFTGVGEEAKGGEAAFSDIGALTLMKEPVWKAQQD